MKTFEGICQNGHIRLKEDAKLPDRSEVLVIVLDKNRSIGIDPARNQRINEAKREARERLRSRQIAGKPTSSTFL